MIFATHNGAKTLPMMLQSLTKIEQSVAWEIIAVDNNSYDGTAIILDSFREALPMTVLRNSKRGKNSGLNLGLRHAKGDLIVFTDDDVIPNTDWLTRFKICAEANQGYDIFAGRILPFWTATPDPIVVNNAPLGTTYALTSDNQVEGPINPGDVWGPNMAVRKSVFKGGHSFNEAVGPDEGNYIMGSETEFTVRVNAAGHKCWFCGAAKVQHIIRQHQMQQKWVIKRAYRSGRGQRNSEVTGKASQARKFLGIPRWRFRALLTQYFRLALSSLSGNRDSRFSALWEISFLKGYIIEGVKQSFRKSSPHIQHDKLK